MMSLEPTRAPQSDLSNAADLRLLAIDTSTEALCLALLAPSGVMAVNAPGGASASARLLPTVHAMLEQAGMRMQDLHGVAFARGPGAFTGVRVACAVAQGLAFGLGCALLPMCSLAVVAEDAAGPSESVAEDAADVGVAMDARMGEVYAARFRREGDRWRPLAGPSLCAPAQVADLWRGVPPVIAGSGLAMLDGGLRASAARCIDQERDRAQALMRLARQEWSAGVRVAPENALPVYLRDQVALTTEQRAARSGRPG